MSKKDDGLNEFPKKYADVLKNLPEFKDTANAASVDDLKKTIVTCESNVYAIEKEKEEDIKLNAAKETVKEFSAPYNDAMKTQVAKIKYVLFLLEGKGIDLTDKD